MLIDLIGMRRGLVTSCRSNKMKAVDGSQSVGRSYRTVEGSIFVAVSERKRRVIARRRGRTVCRPPRRVVSGFVFVVVVLEIRPSSSHGPSGAADVVTSTATSYKYFHR